MTVSATSASGRSARGNSLHGVLKSLSKEYCSKLNRQRSSNKILARSRPLIRKSFTRRVVVSSNNHKDDNSNKCHATSKKMLNVSVQNSNGNGAALQGQDLSEGKSASSVPKDVACVTESQADKELSDGKEDDRSKTSMTMRTKTKLLYPEDSLRYEEAEKVQIEAMNRIEAARKRVANDQVQHIWGLYMYGLKHVLALNDLSDAPDAILPGNF
mmetsp:Transcript_862/g.1803  ORF Transcript_862/g.1803 Transcript_862/m.1803 type:complete len:214 (+) Transcript_862:47-688(+)